MTAYRILREWKGKKAASDYLRNWWAHMGIGKRHRLMTDDMREHEMARARDVAGRSVM